MKRPQLAGHKIIQTRHDGAGRAAASYTAKCECGAYFAPWADRLTVIRSKHAAHLRAVIKDATK